MEKRTCIIEECESPARTRSWCAAHYSKWYSSGADPATAGPKIGRPQRRVGVEACTVEGCQQVMKCRERCAKHYQAWRRANGLDKTWNLPRSRTRIGLGAGTLDEMQCAQCGTAFMPNRSSQIFCSRLCKRGKHRAASQRTRMLRHDAGAERIVRDEIGDRDGWVCGICREPLDRTLRWPESDSQSLDHVVPLSKGGLHRSGNVRIAHLGCNVKRGNRD